MQENTARSFHEGRAHSELSAAYRSIDSEEAEIHLTLALFHLERLRSHGRAERKKKGGKHNGFAIYHTDKEA